MDPIHPTLRNSIGVKDSAKSRRSGNLLANFGKNIRQSAAVPPPPQIPATQPLPPLSHTEGFRPRSNSEETVRDSVSVGDDGHLKRQNSRETLPDETLGTDVLPRTCSIETLPDIGGDATGAQTQAMPDDFPSTQVVPDSLGATQMSDPDTNAPTQCIVFTPTVSEPAFASSESAVASAEPAVASAESAVASAEPAVASAESAVASAEPAVASAESVVASAEPVVAKTEPVSASAEPAIASTEPAIASAEPAIASAVPVVASSSQALPGRQLIALSPPASRRKVVASPSRAVVAQEENVGAASDILQPVAPKRRTKLKQEPKPAKTVDVSMHPLVSNALVEVEPKISSWGWDADSENFIVDGDFAVLKRTTANSFKIPLTVYHNLYDYQRSSVAWLAGLYLNRHGGILGDDMGMGKTVQIAALLSGVWTSQIGRHFLIAVPVTLIENWKRELTNWCAGLPIHVLYGTATERHKALENGYKDGGVVLTSYDLVKNILDDVRAVSRPKAKAKRARKRKVDTTFVDEMDGAAAQIVPVLEENHPWDIIVLDEAHRVKNTACKAANALRSVRARACIMLSGTPLQNNLKELWALMDICMPGLLGNRATFETAFSEPISAGSKRDATEYAVQLKDHLSRRLKRTIAPHFLRRTKDKVEEMSMIPVKTDILVWLKLSPDQERFYKMLLESDVVNQARAKNNNGVAAVFRSLRLLQNMCNHPLLLLKPYDYNLLLTKWGHVTPDMEEEEDLNDEAWRRDIKELVTDTAEKATDLSSKLRFLSVLLPALKTRGHRCLIFSRSTKMLNLVQQCVLRPLGLKFLRLDGTLHSEERDIKVAKFESPEFYDKFFCMCLTIQVGGVGLTLTSADRVVIIDPSWNPAVDMQAIDRTHRLGQTKPVVVYRLVGSGAIEDKIFRYQIFKRGVVKTLLEEENQTRYFTKDDMKDLFSFGEKTQMVLQDKGYELESEHILNTITDDVGEVDQSNPFWSCADLEGFADYSALFSQLDPTTELDSEAQEQAQEAINKLRDEEYVPEKAPLTNCESSSGSRVADDDELPLVAVETPPPKRRKAWAKE